MKLSCRIWLFFAEPRSVCPRGPSQRALYALGEAPLHSHNCPVVRARKINPKGPEVGDLKVLRGGAWDTPRPANLSWLRQTFMRPGETKRVTGFRCAKNGQ